MRKLILAALTLICILASTQAQNSSAEDLARRTVERRAVEAVNWGMPAVNFDLMFRAMTDSAKGKSNQIVYWSRLPDWKNQTLTPNPDVIYLMPFFNTKEVGPMVLEVPLAGDGSITGTIMDAWQAALEDVGPAGVDQGKGGKYLILPPDYKGVPPNGYIVLPSMTYQGYALLRSNLASARDTDVAEAVAYGKRISSIRSRRPITHRQPHSSMPSTWFMTRRYRMTCAFFSRSTASCRPSHGCRAIR
jgi:hypothetical protein